MNSNPSPCRSEAKNLTLGDLIARTYNVRGEKGALNLLGLAMATGVVKFSRRKRLNEWQVSL